MRGSLPLTVRWPSALGRGRVLFIVCAYHGRDRDDTRQGFLERGESDNARAHRILHRDHYANPRPLPYVMALLAAGAELLCEQPPDVVIDATWETAASAGSVEWGGAVERAAVVVEENWRAGLLAQVSRYDHVVLIYPDALGLGCATVDRAALARHGSVLVINGRRRAFRLDHALHRELQFHRWLAHTRLFERVLAKIVRPYAALLARRDRAAIHV